MSSNRNDRRNGTKIEDEDIFDRLSKRVATVEVGGQEVVLRLPTHDELSDVMAIVKAFIAADDDTKVKVFGDLCGSCLLYTVTGHRDRTREEWAAIAMSAFVNKENGIETLVMTSMKLCGYEDLARTVFHPDPAAPTDNKVPPVDHVAEVDENVGEALTK